MNEVEIVDLAGLNLDPDMSEALEDAFRRGYCHGFGAATDAVESLLGTFGRRTLWGILARHCDGPLRQWRISGLGYLAPRIDRRSAKSARTAVTSNVRRAVLMRDAHRCTICGATENLQVDHIKPVVSGGGAEKANLRSLCRSCNLARNSAG